MHAPAVVYRLRDRLALTRAELSALFVVATLFAGGLAVQALPAPQAPLDAEVVRYQAALATIPVPATTALAADTASLPVAAEPVRRTARKQLATTARPVPLNTATAAQLETLPRVGPKLAQRILDYRAARGGFSRVEELRQVKGIGAKTLEGLRPLVTLE